MKRIQLVAPHKLCVEDVPIDFRIPEEHALVKVAVVSLCGSDYKLFQGKYSGPSVYPIVFGHEWSGSVIQVNSKSSTINKGDKVTGDCSKWCGECALCNDDKNLCSNIEKFGITTDGFSQQIVLVPLKHLYSAPMTISYDVLALAECFSVALHAIKKLPDMQNLTKNQPKVLILGGGPIGLALYWLLIEHFSIADITIFETSTVRRYLLEKLIRKTLPVPDYVEQVGNTYKSWLAFSGYDVVFEAVGKPETLQQSLYLSSPMGSIVCLGMPLPGHVDFVPVIAKSLRIFGSIGGTGEFEEIISFLNKHQELVSTMTTKAYLLDDAADAFNPENVEKNMKVQILFSEKEKL